LFHIKEAKKMDAFHTETQEHHGLTVQIEYISDDDRRGYPWEDYDGHGIIRHAYSHYSRPDKKPGEVVIYSGRDGHWIYDLAETTQKAKAENWGITGDTSGLTAKQITALAVRQDMDYCRKFLDGSIFYVGIRCTVLNANGEETEHEDSCWGIEYGYGKDSDYAKGEAASMAESLASHVMAERKANWGAALAEARERRYWAERDIVTI
jgi:hypothetical protein